MNYNPQKHHRRSIRLKGYDYSQAGLYFITICCQDRICRFGHVENGEMILNELGMVAYNEWAKLPERFPNIELDVFQIMPNHIHGIIALVGATLAVAPNDAIAPNDENGQPQGIVRTPNNAIAQNDENGQPQGIARTPNDAIAQNKIDIRATARVAPTVSDIVGAYKSLVANECLKIFKSNNETMGKLCQRNYHEHIIRNEQSYIKISEYITNNPANWDNDTLK